MANQDTVTVLATNINTDQSQTPVMEMEQNKPDVDPMQDGRDKGWAWVVLTSNFILQILITGLLSSLGVYLVEWEKQFTAPVSQLSWLIALILGIAFISGPFGSALSKVFSVRQVVISGSIVTTLSFIAASFTSQLWHLYLIFILTGFGMGIIYQVSYVITVYYFDKLLGRANGVSQTGGGIGIFAMPPLLQLLIDTYGWRGSLLVMASVLGNVAVCGALFRSTPLEIENRVSQTEQLGPRKKGPVATIIQSVLKVFDFKLFRYFYFNILLLGYFLTSFSYTIIIQYLPSRANSSGISNFRAASLVSALGIGSLVGRLTHGFIIDYRLLSTSALTALSLIASALVTVLNPVSDNYWSLMVISAIAGVASGVYFSTIVILTKEYVGVENVSGGMGLMNLASGLAVVLALYSTGLVVDMTSSYDIPFYLAAATFCCGSVLLFIHPIINNLHRRYELNTLRGQHNVALELEDINQSQSTVAFSSN